MDILVGLNEAEIKWILAITEPRVAADPQNVFHDPSQGIDQKLREALASHEEVNA